MAPPSQLAITTSSVLRLVKEESTYHAELAQQEARVAELQQGGGAVAEDGENAEYMLKQEQKAVEETKAVFPELRNKIRIAIENLELQLEVSKRDSNVDPDEVAKARQVVADMKGSYN